jgi:CHRD domain
MGAAFSREGGKDMQTLRLRAGLVIGLAIAFVVATAPGAGADHLPHVTGHLDGYQEVPTLSTTGKGAFTAAIDDGAMVISYELGYEGLESPITAAHLHLGRPAVNGGVIAFLCGGGGKPACPATGTVSGTIVPADILGLEAQGIAAGSFAEVVRAIRRGAVYANVHTTGRPAGEIRGQLRVNRGVTN